MLKLTNRELLLSFGAASILAVAIIFMQAKYDADTARPDQQPYRIEPPVAPEERTADATRMLAVLTGVLGAGTWGLFWYTRKLAADAKISGERQLRAYVHFDHGFPGTVSPQNLGTKAPFVCKFAIRNLGKTPAYNLRCRTAVGVNPFPLPTSYADPVWEDSQEPSGGVIGPDQQQQLTAVSGALFSDELWSDAIASRGRRIYLSVRLDYIDTFGVDHLTTVCMGCKWTGPTKVVWEHVEGRSDAT